MNFLSSKNFLLYSITIAINNFFPSQCDNKASEDSIPVHVLALEGGATTEISSQHPVPDSAVMTTPGATSA